MNDEPTKSPNLVVEHVTCLACGCLCDDIRVEVEAGRIVEAVNACTIGRPWFMASRPGEGHLNASIDGQAAGLEAAIGRAVKILKAAKAPVIWGLSGTTIESVATALAIADRIGAVVDLAGPSSGAASLAAFQRVGLVSASLGEVKDRAEVVVFWGVDPVLTHPRHWERYSVAPRGRFVPEGRGGRFVIVVGSEPSKSSRLADLFIQIDPEREAETLEVLRALVRGVAIDTDRAIRSIRIPLLVIESLAAHLKRARYGALFFGPLSGRMAAESLSRLIRDLNEGHRFVSLELGEPGNLAGASAVIGWQAGAPSSVDYGLGYPRHLAGEATLLERLAPKEVDAVLILGADPNEGWPPWALDQIAKVPTIRIAPGSTAPGLVANVAVDVGRPGIEVGGTVARVDGVMLPLRPAITSDLPSDRSILEALLRRLENRSPF